ncbi:tubulin/FtsZ family protein [Halodesulfurarchaeum sp.]|uniref:tubulin/FtsZ family protein n=1 Tax=Halodesulfurarchaeum sp. TaxID=1980530 RepID=UPI001BC09F34|nr:cell division protein [Halodesulfurarchaeum sp.]
MKAALIGLGQAGGRVAEAIRDADHEAGYDAVRGVLAVNTARSDLQGLDVETMLIGEDRVSGHGVGADNELGASIMQADVGEVLTGLDGIVHPETEAILLIAGLGGGTGSGGMPVLAKELRRLYDKPVYGLGILPGRDEGAIYQKNAGQSLQTVARETDSVILLENDAWRQTGESVAESFAAINERIAQRLILLLAAGEAVEGVGESVVDSSEVLNTLRPGQMAAIGYAAADASPDPGENVNVITSTARRALLTDMSIPETTTAEAALVIVAGDPERLSRKGVEKARKWVESETGSMEVRGGDFPVPGERIAVIVLLSGIAGSPRLESFMDRAIEAAEDVDTGPERKTAFETDELDDLF